MKCSFLGSVIINRLAGRGGGGGVWGGPLVFKGGRLGGGGGGGGGGIRRIPWFLRGHSWRISRHQWSESIRSIPAKF